MAEENGQSAINFSISMRKNVKQEMDAIATNFHWSRSQLIELAVLEFISSKDKIHSSIQREAKSKIKVLENTPLSTKEEIIEGTAPPRTVNKKLIPKRRRMGG